MTDVPPNEQPTEQPATAPEPAAPPQPDAVAPAAPPAAPPVKKTKTITKVLIAVVAAVVAIAVGFGVSALLRGLTTSSNQALIEKNVEVAKDQFELPYQVDEVTVLDDIVAEEGAIHYFYTLTGLDPAAVSEEVLESIVLPGLCSTEETKELLDQNVTMKYSYVVAETGDEYHLVYTKDDC